MKHRTKGRRVNLPTPYFQLDGITLYHGDCREILPLLADAGIDLILTDPPHGIGYNPAKQNLRKATPREDIVGDAETMDLRFLFDFRAEKVVFGPNVFPNQLPHRGRWYCWDKRVTPTADDLLGSAFELAWTSRTSGYERIYRVQHGGVINADMPNQRRFHPTQKPIALMEQILADWPTARVVCDPFAGSGTVLLAAYRAGLQAIGIEIEKCYCDVIVSRLRNEPMPLFAACGPSAPATAPAKRATRNRRKGSNGSARKQLQLF